MREFYSIKHSRKVYTLFIDYSQSVITLRLLLELTYYGYENY